MNHLHIKNIILKLFELQEHSFDPHVLDEVELNPKKYTLTEIGEFINDLNNVGSHLRLVFLRNEILIF